MKWEYATLFGEARGKTTTTRSGKPEEEPTLDIVKDMGDEGWELTAVTIDPHTQENAFYFKRPKEE